MTNLTYLKTDSPFYPLFPKGIVPIKNIMIPSPVRLQGDDETRAYMLDWKRCTEEQRDRIAKLVTELRGGDPAEFLTYMNGGGDMPIRVSQTTGCSTDVPFFLE